MDYEQLSRSALIKLLQEHDAALIEAGRDGIGPEHGQQSKRDDGWTSISSIVSNVVLS